MKQELLAQTIKYQNEASDPANSSWVFASAGSGKTKVLIDRLLRLLLENVAGNKILCITFTRVAAMEMRDRVNHVLQNWMAMDDEKLAKIIYELTAKRASNEKIRYAKSLFFKLMDDENAIKISTIHSLCQDVIKIFPFEVGVSPNFELMDQVQERSILAQAKKDIFTSCNQNENLERVVIAINSEINQDDFLKLLTKFLDNKEKISRLRRQFFDIENVIKQVFKSLAIEKDFDEVKYFQEFTSDIDKNILNELIVEIKSQKKATKTDLKILQTFCDIERKDYKVVISELKSIFLKSDGTCRSKICSKSLESYSQFLLAIQDDFVYFIDAINSYKTACLTEFVLRFVDRILDRYQAIKSEKHLLDYDDLITKVNQLLSDDKYKDWVRYRLNGFYDHILVDESQDTNEQQWKIIEAISEDFFSGESSMTNNRTIFVIGDNKQSIFGFQGADPNISSHKYDYYNNLCGGEAEGKIKKLSLNSSFRSLSTVLDFVDNVFLNNEVTIDKNYKQHNSMRDGKGVVEVWPRYQNENNNDVRIDFKERFLARDIITTKDQAKIDLAEHIAKNITQWINDNRSILKRDRDNQDLPITYNDIMIVLRNQTNGFSDILKNTFVKYKIPFKGSSRVRFDDHLMLMDIISVSRFALLPTDDLNLAAMLKSAFFGINEELLLEMCKIKNSKNISLFQVIELLSRIFLSKRSEVIANEFFDNENCDIEVGGMDLQNIYDLYLRLVEVIKNAKSVDILEFFINILTKDMVKVMSEEFGGATSDIIDQFLIIVDNAKSSGYEGLQSFVDFVDHGEIEIKLDQSNENSVTITTIHSAKGLQSPVVIIPDCCFSFGKMPSVTDNLIWISRGDENYGEFELPIWLARKKYCSKILNKELEYRKIKLKEEYFRLFYVALTRAENEIYISGFGDDNDADSWYSIASNNYEK